MATAKDTTASATTTSPIAEADGQTENAGGAPSVGPWHIVGLFLIVAGIVALVLILKSKWNDDTDTVTGVLAVIIPAFATVGAAIFGATVAYGAGKASGQSVGEAAGEAEKDAAVKGGREKVAAAALRPLYEAQRSMNTLVTPLNQLSSPAGGQHFIVDMPNISNAIELPLRDVQQVPAGINEAIRRLQEELPRWAIPFATPGPGRGWDRRLSS